MRTPVAKPAYVAPRYSFFARIEKAWYQFVWTRRANRVVVAERFDVPDVASAIDRIRAARLPSQEANQQARELISRAPEHVGQPVITESHHQPA